VLNREPHVGQHVGFRLVHECGQLRQAGPSLVGDLAPLLAGGGGGADPSGDDAALALARIGHDASAPPDEGPLPKEGS